jgi:hypothetical protein
VRSQNLGQKLRLAVVVLFACLFAASWGLKSSAQQGGGQPPQQQRQISPDTPAEQAYKNIKVLNGMPAGQLDDTMSFFSSSLGVRCDFCHVRPFESDDKEQKKTARRMIQLQMELNSHHLADFGGERISCYTCHHGSPDPARFPALPVAAPMPPPQPQNRPAGQAGAPGAGGGQAAAPAPAPLPSAAEVLSKYVAAVGGRDAVAKLKTRVMHGTREGVRGGAQPFDVTFAEPDKFIVVTTVPAQGQNPAGEVRQSYSGARGWMRNQRGAREGTPAEIADLKAAARYLSVIKIAEPFPSMKVVGRDHIGDKEVYVLVAQPAQNVTQRFYFDTQTGLLLRQLTLRELFLVTVPEQVDYEDYRDVDGVKMPFTIRLFGINPNAATTRKFTDIKTNVPVDDAIFAMPAVTPNP